MIMIPFGEIARNRSVSVRRPVVGEVPDVVPVRSHELFPVCPVPELDIAPVRKTVFVVQGQQFISLRVRTIRHQRLVPTPHVVDRLVLVSGVSGRYFFFI